MKKNKYGTICKTADKRYTVKSKGEKAIADFFFQHGIEYLYESPVKIGRNKVVHPDFYLPKYNVYIEFYGIEKNAWYYQMIIHKKEDMAKTDTQILELYYDDLSNLKAALKSAYRKTMKRGGERN